MVRDQFGRHCHVEADGGDGRVRVRVAAHTPTGLAEQLAGFGAAIEVEGPAAVRDELGRIGAELAARYGR